MARAFNGGTTETLWFAHRIRFCRCPIERPRYALKNPPWPFYSAESTEYTHTYLSGESACYNQGRATARRLSPPEEWFEASEGLKTVQRIQTYLRTSPDCITRAEDVAGDLEEIEQILKAADQAGVRFHLSFDI